MKCYDVRSKILRTYPRELGQTRIEEEIHTPRHCSGYPRRLLNDFPAVSALDVEMDTIKSIM